MVQQVCPALQSPPAGIQPAGVGTGVGVAGALTVIVEFAASVPDCAVTMTDPAAPPVNTTEA